MSNMFNNEMLSHIHRCFRRPKHFNSLTCTKLPQTMKYFMIRIKERHSLFNQIMMTHVHIICDKIFDLKSLCAYHNRPTRFIVNKTFFVLQQLTMKRRQKMTCALKAKNTHFTRSFIKSKCGNYIPLKINLLQK